ncbi:uncharacterized protein BJ212DRAFT_406818 [Suillus subaureus]|uniref:Secreted protein n=1 Tax=Suillus subaureus TaxID=48587 RepID=A0A9P7E7N4_9AGAM|nr:uncharacterized protein BJ212DRAFT_406818 [Suillus subaureus]KAG1813702.1 hypothetical protein BJ212DRAFT_406818 [Suillus subaureus]
MNPIHLHTSIKVATRILTAIICTLLDRVTGEVVRTSVCTGRPRTLDSLDVNVSYCLGGTLFQDDDDNGTISSVFTETYIDHAEPLAVLL